VACSASPSAPASPSPSASASAVSITSAFAFEPAQLTVSRGASVTWTNTTPSTTHTVTSGAPDKPSNKFNHALEAGKTFTVKFDEAGTFDYFCSIHLSMRATVLVK
jgi:plastocyanin